MSGQPVFQRSASGGAPALLAVRVTPKPGALSSMGPLPAMPVYNSLPPSPPAVAVAEGSTTDEFSATMGIGIGGSPALEARPDRSGAKAHGTSLKRAAPTPKMGAVKAARVGSREKSRCVPLLDDRNSVHVDSTGSETEGRYPSSSEDSVNGNEDGGHEVSPDQSTSTETDDISPLTGYTLQPRTASSWTPINKHREIEWERTGPWQQPGLLPTKTKTTSKKQLFKNIVWKAFTDQLRRHDSSLNMTAGRRKKAQELAAERAKEGKRVPAKKKMKTVERLRNDSPDTDGVLQVVSPVE